MKILSKEQGAEPKILFNWKMIEIPPKDKRNESIQSLYGMFIFETSEQPVVISKSAEKMTDIFPGMEVNFNNLPNTPNKTIYPHIDKSVCEENTTASTNAVP